MAFLDDLLGNVLGGQSGDVPQGQGSSVAQAVRNMLNDSSVGGIEGLPQQSQQSGLGDIFR